MKLALLKGNRFNPWHLGVYAHLEPKASITAFRAESEIQRYFEARDDAQNAWRIEPIYFDTDAGPFWQRRWRRIQYRFFGRPPRILPFAEALEGYDVLQSWEIFTDWSAQALMAKQRFDIPLCVQVWDNIPFNMEDTQRLKQIKRALLDGADRFLVHTERSRRMLLLEGAPEERIFKLGPGFDTALFSPTPSPGKDQDSFELLFVGWLLPRKGLDFLLLALRDLFLNKKIRLRLHVIGSGPGRDRIDALVARLGLEEQVRFSGSQPYSAMPAYFQKADAFVLPSIAEAQWQEQFGMSLLEAMSCGTPVISTLSGAIPEIVGPAGLLCQPNDFLSLRQAIESLMDSQALREELGEQGRNRVLRHYSLTEYAHDLSRCYQELL